MASPPPRNGRGFSPTSQFEIPERRRRAPLLPATRLFDSHISAGQFRAIFDGVKFLQPAIEDAWSWFAVVSGPGAEAGDDPCGEGHCSFWVRVGLAFCRIGSLVIGADGLDQGLIALIEGVDQTLAMRIVASADQRGVGDRG